LPKYQAVAETILGFGGFSSVNLGSDGYSLATVFDSFRTRISPTTHRHPDEEKLMITN
jgi:hypothetical protein